MKQVIAKNDINNFFIPMVSERRVVVKMSLSYSEITHLVRKHIKKIPLMYCLAIQLKNSLVFRFQMQ